MEAGSLGPALTSCTIPLPAVPSDLYGPGISYPRGLALRRAVYGQFHTLGAASYCEPMS